MTTNLKRYIYLFVVMFAIIAYAADDIKAPQPPTGQAFIKEVVTGHYAPFNITYTTDGSGHLKLLNSSDPVDDDLLIPDPPTGKAFMKAADGKYYPIQVIYTTDGSGHIIPITGGGGGGSGTVTSVALSLPSIFSVSGSPVTTSGTLTGTLATQTANKVFSGPASGGAATPTFRSLVSADIPSLAYVSGVTASSPLASSGGLAPNITCQAASGSQAGCLSSTDWSTFNGKMNADMSNTSASTAFNNDLIPDADITRALGSNAKRLSNLFALNAQIGTVNSRSNADLTLTSNGIATNIVLNPNNVIDASNKPIRNVQIIRLLANGRDISLQGSASSSVSYTITLPPNAGLSGQVLQNTGSATLAWVTPSTAPSFVKERLVLNGTNITNQYFCLGHVAVTDSVMFQVKHGSLQMEQDDYLVSYTDSNCSGNSSITFNGDLATGGISALISGDIVTTQYVH